MWSNQIQKQDCDNPTGVHKEWRSRGGKGPPSSDQKQQLGGFNLRSNLDKKIIFENSHPNLLESTPPQSDWNKIASLVHSRPGLGEVLARLLMNRENKYGEKSGTLENSGGVGHEPVAFLFLSGNVRGEKRTTSPPVVYHLLSYTSYVLLH